MDEEKKDHVVKMKKMEAEMEQVFEMKVKEKKQKLKDSELEVCKQGKHEITYSMLHLTINQVSNGLLIIVCGEYY